MEPDIPKLARIINNIDTYLSMSETDIDYILSLNNTQIRIVIEKCNKSIQKLLLLNEFLVKEID